MKNKISPRALIIFAAVVLVGSFVNFFATNLLMSDVSNVFYGFHDIYFIGSIPAILFAVLFVMGAIFVAEWNLHPEYRKALICHDLIGVIGISVAGIITSILSGTIVYHSFLKPYPFGGYTIICLVFFILSLLASIILLIKVKKQFPNDESKRKFSLRHLWHNIWFGILCYFAFNRFGALLWMPTYLHLRTLYMTWPYYLWLALPLVLVLVLFADAFGLHKVGTKNGITRHATILAIDLAFTAFNITVGMNNTQFIAAVSPTVAIERLASKPIDTIAQFVLLIGFGIYFLVREIIKYNQNKKEAE